MKTFIKALVGHIRNCRVIAETYELVSENPGPQASET